MKHLYLFGHGLIKCGECGRNVIGSTSKGYKYYYCSKHQTNCSQNKYSKEADLEYQVLDFLESLEIKDGRMLELIKKTLKDSHQYETEYHNKAVEELNREYSQIQQRIDLLYDEKLDGRIPQDFYKKKAEQYQGHLNAILNNIHFHQNATVSYYDLAIRVLELAQQAKEIYIRHSVAEKRRLLNFVFSNLSLLDLNLSPVYAPAFGLVSEMAQNEIWLPG